MSFFAQAWAEKAPVANVYERAILTLLAHRASGKDGSGAFPSQGSMAEFACCSDRQVRNVLTAMQERKLIARGDDRLVINRYPAGRRPQVWDLLIPYKWFSDDQREEIDAERALLGKDPLTPDERPPIAPAERVPAGRKRPKSDGE